jgi:hypothetical protein
VKNISRQKSRLERQWPLWVEEFEPLQQSDAFGLFVLFEAGRRPSGSAIHAFAAAWGNVCVSHDPGAHSSPDGNLPNLASNDEGGQKKVFPLATQWVELLRDGLTFDLQGLAPGPACEVPAVQHLFDWPTGPDFHQYEAMGVMIGPHLEGAQRSVPVLRSMIALARDLVLFFEEIAAVIWQPSASLIGRRFFESTATAWIDGGPFPALGLTAFKLHEDGALQSVGLGVWTNQEIRIEPPLAQDKVAATRLGVRIINHLVLLGGLAREERIIAPDGTPLLLRPDPDGTIIRVQRE